VIVAIAAAIALLWLVAGLGVVTLCVAAARGDRQSAPHAVAPGAEIAPADASVDGARRPRAHAADRRPAPAGSAAAA